MDEEDTILLVIRFRRRSRPPSLPFSLELRPLQFFGEV